MAVTILRALAWVCFALGLLFTVCTLLTVPAPDVLVSVIAWLTIFWVAWIIMLLIARELARRPHRS